MGSMSIVHWLIVLAVVLLLFGGRGRFSSMMGDVGKGMKEFKKSMSDDDAVPPAQIPAQPVDVTPAATPVVTPAQPTLDGKPLPPSDTQR